MTASKGTNTPTRFISTHTLTWSVTSKKSRDTTETYFNSHAHVERDAAAVIPFETFADFNSHAHVERDFWIACGIVYDIDFNSHAHVERDQP